MITCVDNSLDTVMIMALCGFTCCCPGVLDRPSAACVQQLSMRRELMAGTPLKKDCVGTLVADCFWPRRCCEKEVRPLPFVVITCVDNSLDTVMIMALCGFTCCCPGVLDRPSAACVQQLSMRRELMAGTPLKKDCSGDGLGRVILHLF